MRLLLDGHLDRRLKRYFGEQHDIVSVQERAWGSKENGELIQAAQRELEALVTMDRGIPHQQNLERRSSSSVCLERHPTSTSGFIV